MFMKTELLTIAILVFSSALVFGCGGQDAETTTTVSETETERETESLPPPTPEEAARIIQAAPQYSDFRFTSVTLSIPMKEEMMHPDMKAYVRDFERAGWLRLDSTGTVVLANKARKDTRWLERPNGFTDIAPLARKEFVEVSSVEPSEEGVEAHFTYRWIPNETGAAIQGGMLREMFNSPQYATAILKDYGNGWDLYIIRAAEAAPAGDSEVETPSADASATASE